MHRTIYLAGGCFWGLEDLFRDLPGVLKTEVGYCGGLNEHPTYDHHPGHAETIAITYDEKVTSYEKLLDYFFRIHDPTTLNRQGNDVGSSYRSAIFYQTSDQLKTAKKVIVKVNKSNIYKNPVATTLEAFKYFFRAEEEHQKYLLKHPGGYTCHYLRTSESFL